MMIAGGQADRWSPRWSSQMVHRVADAIHCEVKKMVSNSRLVRKSDGIALVHQSDLRVGNLLGKGAFSEVHSVKIIGDSSGQSYAMKHLKSRLMDQPESFRLAGSELAIEAHILASLDHPNIIKIRGWAANGVASFTTGRHDSFFLLLDILDETLDHRITSWEKEEAYRKNRSPNYNIVRDLWRKLSQPEEVSDGYDHAVDVERALYRKRDETEYLEKLGICCEIASALSYLHDNGIVFRDLKPNNIGFLNGKVKLFDFGLSRELPGRSLTQPFEMSGKVGTLRYMAVEVACHLPYNVASDVYSWAMVCYEIFALQKPFAGWTRDMHADLVCGRGVRPETSQMPPAIRAVLELSWSQHPDRRPPMKAIGDQMRFMEEQQLMVVHSIMKSTQDLVVELPSDFDLKRKIPDRNQSGLTANTSLISTESMDFYP